VHPTNRRRFADNDIAVSIIDTPTFNAYSSCTFYTPGEKALVQSLGEDKRQQIIIGPPQPVTGVKCEGYCLGLYCKSGSSYSLS
jgi:hypothetical protein